MKYGSYYQIAHKETNEIISYMGETKFYSLDKAQEAMSDFENQEISAFEDYESRLQPKDYRIVERKGYFF